MQATEATRAVGTSVVVRLLAAHNALIVALRNGLGPALSLARFDLLATLDREDGQTLAALSRKLLVTAGNLTGLVDRAARDGIVERRPDAKDRRLTRVHLTPKGQKLATQAIRRHQRLAEELVGALDRRDRESLRELLGRLRESIQRKSKNGTKAKGAR
jgi:DNA-binding MarR family transcriptional regulator